MIQTFLFVYLLEGFSALVDGLRSGRDLLPSWCCCYFRAVTGGSLRQNESVFELPNNRKLCIFLKQTLASGYRLTFLGCTLSNLLSPRILL